MKKHERMNQQIYLHGLRLKEVFHLDDSIDTVKLAKKIHRMEVKAHKLSTDYCNGDVTVDQWEVETEKLLDTLDKVIHFRALNIPVFVNGDARGYALKIDDEYVREHNLDIYKDWGGYGILAPEFDGNN